MEKETIKRNSQLVNKADLNPKELEGLDLSGKHKHLIRCVECGVVFVAKSPVAMRCPPHRLEHEKEMWRMKRKKSLKGTIVGKEITNEEYNRRIAKHIKFR